MLIQQPRADCDRCLHDHDCATDIPARDLDCKAACFGLTKNQQHNTFVVGSAQHDAQMSSHEPDDRKVNSHLIPQSVSFILLRPFCFCHSLDQLPNLLVCPVLVLLQHLNSLHHGIPLFLPAVTSIAHRGQLIKPLLGLLHSLRATYGSQVA